MFRASAPGLQKLVALLDEEDALNADCSVAITDVVVRGEVLNKQRQDGKKLWLCELCPERVQESDSVNLQKGVDGSGGRLQVLEDVLGEESDDVN